MLHGWLDAETELVAGGDGECVWCCWCVEAAAEVDRGYVLDWAVRVLVLTHADLMRVSEMKRIDCGMLQETYRETIVVG